MRQITPEFPLSVVVWKWGTKYGTHDVNTLAEPIKTQADAHTAAAIDEALEDLLTASVADLMDQGGIPGQEGLL